MEQQYQISASPHLRDKITTQYIMFAVMACLLPATIMGIFNFGPKALLIIVLSIASAVLTEYLYQKGMKKEITIKDGSAALTGLLIGLNVPVSVPWWMPVMGSVFAILIVKQLFGGLGQNFMNPALAARCFLLIAFAKHMTSFTYDGVSTATPLADVKAGQAVNTWTMFLGNEAGTIGETSALLILIGAIVLLGLGIIDLRIPFSCIFTFLVFILIFGCGVQGRGLDLNYISAQLSGGGLMLGVWFMATDYVTSPITKNGQILYGICIGLLTGIFRLFGPSTVTEGMSYAIIISNLLVPLIENITIPKAFGRGGE